MTNRSHPIRFAGVASVAALALTPLAAAAQVAVEPPPPAPITLEAPPVPVAPAPAPSTPIVVPEVFTAPVETAPPAETTPAPAAPSADATPAREPRTAAPAPAARTRTPAAAPASSEPVEAAAPVAPTPEPAVEAAPVVPAAETVAEGPVAPIAAAEQATPARGISAELLALAIGGLLVIALAIWGFVALGRRRSPAERAAVPVIEKPVVAQPTLQPTAAAPTPSRFAQPIPTPAASLAHSGASVALPRRMPESFAERDALLKRMVAAKPDRANPFTGYKARVRRARLILQSLGRDFGDTKPWIDLSQYTSNWPELARQQTAAA